ncbi:MAG: PAS domain S-box protein, partial [Spirochaetales bacterium]|nr:PAS domain S-box protein [Spirochaetales bacterium]
EILRIKDIPVVFLSSHTEPAIVEKTEKITSYGYVVKNSGIVVLDASIKMAFKLYEAKILQKQREEELQKSEYKYRMLFENMNVSFGLHEAIYDDSGNPVDFRYVDMNPKFLDNLGSSASAICGHTAKELFPKTEQYWIDTFGEVAKTGKSATFQNYSSELDQWFNTFAFCPQENYFASFFIDITEQKKAEEALKASENRLRHLMKHLPGTAWIVDKELKFTLSLGAGLEKIGLKPDQVVGMSLYEFFDTKDDNHIVISSHLNALNGNTVQYEQSYDHLTFGTSLSPVYDENGSIMAVAGLSLDISDRKQAETSKRENENFYRTIIQTSKDGFWTIDAQSGRITDANDTYCRLSGYEKEELLTLSISDIDSMEDPLQTQEHMRYVIANGSDLFETRHRRKDGSLFDAEISVTYSPEKNGQFVCFCRDISARKRALG